MNDLNAEPVSKRRLKMWLRLLNVNRKAESHLREYLRVKHHTTLPRFDVLAALYRSRKSITMSELSRMLLVSNGNATAVVDRLERDGLVQRKASETDRRTIFAALTAAGIRAFEVLAVGHEREVSTLFDNLSEADLETLTSLLKRTGKGE